MPNRRGSLSKRKSGQSTGNVRYFEERMKHFRTIVVAVLFVVSTGGDSTLSAQESGSAAVRESKFDVIVRCQDRRSQATDTLLTFTRDLDPLVRERAAPAFGSLQDTTKNPLLYALLYGYLLPVVA